MTTVGTRVAVFSRRNIAQHVWLASQYEFEDVICGIEDATLVAPSIRSPNAQTVVQKVGNRLRRTLGRPRPSGMVAETDSVLAEVFFAIFAAPHEIDALAGVRDTVAGASTKVAFIVELWRSGVDRARPQLEQLRGFDHIFLFSREVIPLVAQITGVPCSYLPTAVDMLRFAPPSPGPARYIDVTSYGRRLQGTHEALLAAAESGQLHYSYTTTRGGFEVTGYREHRLALAATLQRSRYAVVYKNNDVAHRLAVTGGEESLTNRYFEAVAAGAVMLGTAPDVSDFRDCFDWPDALVTIDAPAPDIIDRIARLDADPARLERVRRENVIQSLRRHDWAHRWRDIMITVGLPPGDAVTARLTALDERAAELASSGEPWLATPAGMPQSERDL